MTLFPSDADLAPLCGPAPAGEDRPTRLTDAEVRELRERARREAGPFVDPKVIAARRYFHNRDWAAAIVGDPDFSLESWPTLYLLAIAMEAEPEPPLPRTQPGEQAAAEERAHAAATMRARRAERAVARHRAETAEWLAAVRTCLVKVVVRESRHSRIRGGAREHLRHVVPLSEAVSGARRRHRAGRALCETPHRAKPLALSDESTDQPATCRRCLAYVSQIRMAAATGFPVLPALDLAPGTLLVAVGPGASGKSTYADTAAVDAVVCLDSLRREIGGDAGDQSVTPAAVERQNALLEQHLGAGATVFLDSTNVEPHVRAQLVERARRHGRPVVALRFLPDLGTCLTRNGLRPANRRVPDDTLRWQHDLTQEATADALLREGFIAVHHIAPTPVHARPTVL